MPFYEYECSSCKFYTEVMQKMSDAPLTKCPSCGRKALRKLVSAPVFRLKGGGWYETDFKADNENKRNLVGAEKDEAPAKKEGSAAAADTAKGESAKADSTKADSKADSAPAKPVEAKSDSGAGAAKSAKKTSRPAKPAPRVAAKSATRSKSTTRPARKKARR